MTNQNGKRALPLLPNADHLRKQAKARLVALKTEQPEVRLADAQRCLAQEYGFARWTELQAEVARRSTAPHARRIHLRRAIAAFLSSKAQHASLTESEDASPLMFLRAGLVVQVGFVIVVLLGIGVVCVAMHRAGVPLRSDQGQGPTTREVLHKVI